MSSSSQAAEAKSAKGMRSPVLTISILAMFTALVFVITQFAWLPISVVPGQRFDAGDIMIFIAAWTFGPIVGGFAGGVGSSLSDALVGGAPYWPFTLVIKGLEGTVAGLLYRRGSPSRLIISWLIASCIMLGGYFATNAVLLGLVIGTNSPLNPGLINALLEVPFDIVQVSAGGIIGSQVSKYVRNSFPSLF